MKNDWKTVKIREIASFNNDSYSLKDNWNYVNYLDTGSITENKIEFIQYIDLNKEALPSRAKRKVDNDDIVYSTVRPNQLHYGFIQGKPENFLVSTGFAVVKCLQEYACPKYIYYYLIQDQITEYLQSIAEQSVSAYPSIKSSDIGDLEIELPDLETQKKIAKVLSALDDKIELNNQINKNLEEQIKSIFESWFVTFNHFGGSKPSEMQHVPLEQLCEVVTKGTTPTTMGKAFVSHGVNFIKAETITDSHTIDFERLAHIDNETDSMLKRSRIKKGDILFTIAGTLGRFALVDSDVLPANTNQAVAIIRPNQNKVSSEYLYSFLIANWHNDYYSKRIQQAVQANLSLTTIKSLPIAILSRELAQQYDKLIRKLISLIKANEQENRKLFQFRDALLPKLMSGEIDVDDVEI